MGFDDESEKKAHRTMAVFFGIIIVVFILFKVYENSNVGSKDTTAEPTATVEATATVEE